MVAVYSNMELHKSSLTEIKWKVYDDKLCPIYLCSCKGGAESQYQILHGKMKN